MTQNFIIAVSLLIAPFTGTEEPPSARERGLSATVKVTCEKDSQFGSGVAIARANGHTYILTAQHLVPTAKKASVTVPGGKTFVANVLARSVEKDLAVLRIAGTAALPRALPLAAAGVKPEKDLLSLGWAKGDAPTAIEETLLGKVRLKRPGETNAELCWEVERKPAAGRSGGPLMDSTGAVVGIASGHDGSSGYYVHVDEIRPFLRQSGLQWLTEEDER